MKVTKAYLCRNFFCVTVQFLDLYSSVKNVMYSTNLESEYPYKRSDVAERSSELDSSSGVGRMWVRIPAWPVTTLVSLSKTPNHNCFVFRMGRKAVGPVCCVMHVKEPRLAPVFLDLAAICATGFPGHLLKNSVSLKGLLRLNNK